MSLGLFLPTSSLITASVETVLNRLITDEPHHLAQMKRLQGKVIAIHLREFDLRLFFVFSQRIDVLADYEGTPDCALSFKLSVLPALKEQSNITALIKQDQLMLDGDIQLAQQFSKLLTQAQPDIEELLSGVIGDVMAYQVVQTAKDTKNWLKEKAQIHQEQLAQACVHEWKIAPAPLELAYFCDQVDVIDHEAEKLEQRVEIVLSKLSISGLALQTTSEAS